MPTNRTRRRRSAGSVAELPAWSSVFGFGWDFFDELRNLGTVAVDAYGRPSREDLREAWERLGQAYMATWVGAPHHPEPWVVTELAKQESPEEAGQ